MEESLKWQLSHLSRVTRALGVQALTAPGFEADDVIGTLARAASTASDGSAAPFERVIILSSDKDFVQCLNARVSMLSPKRVTRGGGACYVYMHHSDVLETMGVPPERFIDFLVLLGDAADGIPGIDGIGAVRAKQILTHYDSIDAAIKDIKSHDAHVHTGGVGSSSPG